MGVGSSVSKARSKDLVAPITVKIDGEALDPAKAGNKLVEVVVKKLRVLPDSAQIRIMDPKVELVDSSLKRMGSTLEVLVGAPSATSPKTLFKGPIAVIEPEFLKEGVVVSLRAYDPSHAMTRSAHSRAFQDKTIGDIVEQVVGKYGLSISVSGATGAPIPSMMQSNESDWDFVWRLAKRIGFEIVVDGEKAKFQPMGESAGDAPFLQYGSSEPGHQLYSFRPRVSSANVPEKVTASYVTAKGTKLKVSVNTQDGKVKTAAETDAGSMLKVVGNGKGGIMAIPNLVAEDEAELKKLVEAARDRIIATNIEAEGVAEGHPDLRPGMTVEIKKVGKFSGKYVLSETVHTYRGSTGYKTRFAISGRPKNILAAVDTSPVDVSASGGSGGAGGVGSSIMRGEVTDTKDPENLGRVRVKFPSIAQEEPPEGWWARIAVPSAGKERGLLMMPLVGDRVVVGFENGDTRSPFVLGSIFEAKVEPGQDLVKSDGSFALKSDESIYMKAGKDLAIDLAGAWAAKVAGKIGFESQGNMEFKSSGDVVIKAANITFDAMQNVTIKGGTNIDLKAMMIKVNANANLELKGSAMVTVGGGMVKLG